MTEPSPEFVARYTAALKEFLHERGEAALQQAYELGRAALTEGLGLLDIVMIYHRAMGRILPSADGDVTGSIDAAGQFLAESLSPFEMTHRGYREANEALQASEKRYRELFENANDVVFTTDLAGEMTSVNRAGEKLTGYQRDEVSAMNITTLVAPEHVAIAQRMLTRKLTGEVEDTRYEVDIIARDGRRIPMEVHTSLLYQDGQPVGIQGIARDVTERRQAEQALRGLNERLEEEARRIAHALHDEAGQLLSSVHLALDEYAHGLPPDGRRHLHPIKELLSQIEEELRRLSHELRPTILDDLGLLPALEILADRVAKRSGLAVTVRGDTGGRLAPPLETALYRSVQEALTNAGRHARATRVDVEIRREGDVIRGSVRDDGAGFDSTTVFSRRGNRGLGLTGIRERATALGGTLVIRTAPGEGTHLLITLPTGRGN
jgi:two-component system, NarL family, sensor histidine kinase UhpB